MVNSTPEGQQYKFRRWTNPYIDKSATKPGYLLPFLTEEVSDQDIVDFREKISGFSRIVVELGSGSGGHLISLAARDPGAIHLGFELRFKRAVRTAEKAAQRDLHNLLVLRTTAFNLGNFLPEQCIDAVYVNFPDPWAKKRWKKHRMLNNDFIVTLHKLLKPQGFLSYKTDHLEYFDEVVELVTKLGIFSVEKFTKDLYSSPYLLGNTPTEFEKLFRSKDLPVLFTELKKITTSSSFVL